MLTSVQRSSSQPFVDGIMEARSACNEDAVLDKWDTTQVRMKQCQHSMTAACRPPRLLGRTTHSARTSTATPTATRHWVRTCHHSSHTYTIHRWRHIPRLGKVDQRQPRGRMRQRPQLQRAHHQQPRGHAVHVQPRLRVGHRRHGRLLVFGQRVEQLHVHWARQQFQHVGAAHQLHVVRQPQHVGVGASNPSVLQQWRGLCVH